MKKLRIFLALVLPAIPIGSISGCGTCGQDVEVRHVAPPPKDASAREIVQSYLQALAGHDKQTGRSMWDHSSPQYEAEFADPVSNFTNWTSLTDVEIGEPEAESCGDIQRCVRVPVSYAFEQCEFYTGDDGPYSERFFLDKIDGRWLISGHGQG
ncbi:hypothetical protein [Microbispora sp. H10830]|uniref:hypothetical protein n=1 Tax=Microbispora sp. H10830 TaxID=2729109 RepID=UPI0015FFAAFB|nr:hypothetical protein [Microbispora sp. H10830]